MRFKHLITCLLYLSLAVPCFSQQETIPNELFYIKIWDFTSRCNVNTYNVFTKSLDDYYIDYSDEDAIVYNIFQNSIPAPGNVQEAIYLDPVIRKKAIGNLLDSSFGDKRSRCYNLNWLKIRHYVFQSGTSMYVYPSDHRKLIISVYLIKAEFHEIPISCLQIFSSIKQYIPDNMQSSNTYIFDRFEYVELIKMQDYDVDTVEKCIRFQYRPSVRFEWSDDPLKSSQP